MRSPSRIRASRRGPAHQRRVPARFGLPASHLREIEGRQPTHTRDRVPCIWGVGRPDGSQDLSSGDKRGAARRSVVPRSEGDWAVEGRASAIAPTRWAAEARARSIVKNLGGEVRIHGRDGRIREFDTVAKGNALNPPGTLETYISGSLAAGLMIRPVTDGDCGACTRPTGLPGPRT